MLLSRTGDSISKLTAMEKQTFTEMIHSAVPTVVDFYANWCGPCKAMTPVLEDVKHELGDKANILKVDVDRNPQAADIYEVWSVPTLILFRGGKIVWRQSGVVSAELLKDVIRKNS
jgi:thioredoxin 1